MRSNKVSFSSRDGLRLAGRLDLPDATEPLAGVVFAHCFTCHKDFKAGYHLSRALTRLGLAVLRFDFPGLGESEGDFAATTLTANARDVAAAAAFLAARVEGAPTILLGHSMGGVAALLAAPALPFVEAVAVLAAPFEPGRLPPELAAGREAARERGEAEIVVGGRALRLGAAFFDDLASASVGPALGALARPLFVFHSPQDDVVPVAEGERLFAAARHPKTYVGLDGADHLLSRDSDASYVAEVLAAWVRRRRGAESGGARDAPVEGVAVRGGSGFRAEVRAGRHRLWADEPEADGGTDTGPNPYQYLLAGLGACTAMTLRLYADRKGWPLTGAEVRLDHDRIHAEDCAECETRTGKVDRITRSIALLGPLDEAQRQRLREIADRCPVHRTLTSEIRIETVLRPQR